MSLPVSLLAGLSTSLRDDLVRCLVLRRPGMVAVVYDVEPRPEGARLVRRVLDAGGTAQREHVELIGCCLSCTVRDDAPQALELVGAVDRWTEVLLALPAALQPETVRHALGGSAAVALDTVSTVVDAVLLRAQIGGDDLLAERGLAAAPTDRRSTAQLVVGQLEDADVLAVVGLERLDTEQAQTVQALLAHLAPLAVQVPIGPGGTGCDELVGTGRHDPATTAGERERLAALAAELCPAACGVSTLVWNSERPLHSGRLADALPEIVQGVVRSRGHIWLADRPRSRVRWESAGGSLSFGDPVPWRALPDCTLVLTGIGLEAQRLVARLESCLATDAELGGAPDWPDPFADALGPAEQHSRR